MSETLTFLSDVLVSFLSLFSSYPYILAILFLPLVSFIIFSLFSIFWKSADSLDFSSVLFARRRKSGKVGKSFSSLELAFVDVDGVGYFRFRSPFSRFGRRRLSKKPKKNNVDSLKGGD